MQNTSTQSNISLIKIKISKVSSLSVSKPLEATERNAKERKVFKYLVDEQKSTFCNFKLQPLLLLLIGRNCFLMQCLQIKISEISYS